MKKTIIWIAITFCLLLVVSVVLYSLSITVKLETNEYEIKETFENIKIITDTADIDFVLSENLNTLIICEEHKNIKHAVNVKENTLLVEVLSGVNRYNVGDVIPNSGDIQQRVIEFIVNFNSYSIILYESNVIRNSWIFIW